MLHPVTDKKKLVLFTSQGSFQITSHITEHHGSSLLLSELWGYVSLRIAHTQSYTRVHCCSREHLFHRVCGLYGFNTKSELSFAALLWFLKSYYTLSLTQCRYSCTCNTTAAVVFDIKSPADFQKPTAPAACGHYSGCGSKWTKYNWFMLYIN